ncbi:Uncharacterized protein HZ326_3758 [Fusarium oxysporum f. sp. albedinis]|nr:Uncharacterized protein HZ326_3758 [Fusarium oxysporum f. sp. albedinis]
MSGVSATTASCSQRDAGPEPPTTNGLSTHEQELHLDGSTWCKKTSEVKVGCQNELVKELFKHRPTCLNLFIT